MSRTPLVEALWQAVSADQIRKDVDRLIAEDFATPADIDDQLIEAPSNAPIEIVSTCLISSNFEVGFGDHFRILVALGGVREVSSGIAKANLCFVLMYYSIDGKLITVDYCIAMP